MYSRGNKNYYFPLTQILRNLTILKVLNQFIKNKPKTQYTRYKTKTEVK